MRDMQDAGARRTTVDMVFDQLHEEIQSLTLLPGSKISESDVAKRLGVSRQPVRDAFNRLENLDLLSIRPQRATTVCKFSLERIGNARFIRMAVELETLRMAVAVWDAERADLLRENLDEQRAALGEGDINRFHSLDYRFHQMICDLCGYPLAFETILRCKQSVDRLCVLSLAREQEASAVLTDHEEIAKALEEGSEETLERIIRRHLGRLDGPIQDIHTEHSEYFE